MNYSPILLNVLNSGHYYLDPGTGSILIQALLAGLLGAAYAVKVYWRQIKKIFRPPKNTEETVQKLGDGNKPDDPAN